MTQKEKDLITQISKDFASAFKDTIGEIKGSEFFIVDPLSGYLNFEGYENTLEQIPAYEGRPQVLIMTFKDGSKFIPAGSDLAMPGAKDWMWLSFEAVK